MIIVDTREEMYQMIYKRKSFHLFRNIGEQKISEEEMKEIHTICNEATPLCKDIKTKIKVVPADKTTCNRGEEYCILFYSERKDNYLQNIGYIGGQIELQLTNKDIGCLWFGIGKVEETEIDDMEFVIMIAIAKIDDANKFRKDMFKSKRKAIEEIWQGNILQGVTEIVRYTPSSCNTQPWLVENEDNAYKIYRYKKPGKRGIMPIAKVTYYNKIDIGIFYLFFELCLEHQKKKYDRELCIDQGAEEEKTLAAIYRLL